MDDDLSLPTSQAPASSSQEQPDLSSDEEDGAPDWSKFLQKSARHGKGHLSIPKRGEKEFEPSSSSGVGAGSNLQSHVLSKAREDMLSVLRTAERISVSKAMSFGVWVPELSRAYITIQRGVLWQTMGHSAPRGKAKRTELLPEETLYLIERGNLWCSLENQLQDNPNSEIPGPPISAQQAFSEIIGNEDLTLEKYQVYAYLKRLGYIVTRTKAPDPYYPLPPPFVPVLSQKNNNLWRCFINVIFAPFKVIQKVFFPQQTLNWWKPLGGQLRSLWNYPMVFNALRSIPILAGHIVPLRATKLHQSLTSPYADGPFYNVYKPGTPYRKTMPDKRPDFQITVVDARTSRMPSLYEFEALYGMLDVATPPVPRRRNPPPVTSLPKSTLPWYSKWFPIFSNKNLPYNNSRPNPFPHLRQGTKIAIIAVVDSGSVGFFRFGQGSFEEWPMNFGA